jgi:hypothetical protein
LEVSLALTEAQLLGEQPIDEPLPVGRTLVRALENRISGLPDDARRALLVAAASGAESVQPVVDALGALGLDRGSSTPPSRPACCRWRAGVAVTGACAPGRRRANGFVEGDEPLGVRAVRRRNARQHLKETRPGWCRGRSPAVAP